jgi:predicted enzyme related to lactoylglutathione lyase
LHLATSLAVYTFSLSPTSQDVADRAHPAQKFYKTVFDWTFNAPTAKEKDASGNIELAKFDFNPDIKLTGSVRRTPEETGVLSPGRGGICLYWLVDDVEKIGEVIEKEGGKMLSGAVKEGEFGLYRFFEDTEGNLGAVYAIKK